MELILFVLVGLLACCLVGSMWRLIAEPESARVLRRSFLPVVEWLSERVVPAGTFIWLGGDMTKPHAWEEPNNWNGPAGRYPGNLDALGNPILDDQVSFDVAGQEDCILASNRTVAKLSLKASFGKVLKVDQGKDLIVSGGPGFSMSGGTLHLIAGASLSLRASATHHKYEGGDLNSTGNGDGTIFVSNQAHLDFEKDGTKLGANLKIGQDRAGNDSSGFVNFASETTNLNAHVTLYKNVNIVNYKLGAIEFKQSQNSDTKGGIDRTASSTSRIDNYGWMTRLVQDTVFLKIVPPAESLGGNALLHVGHKCKIEFVNFYTLLQGNIDASADGARIKGLKGFGGAFRLTDPGAPGTYVASILRDVEWNAGDIVFDFTTSGVNATLELTDSLFMNGGTVTVPASQHLTIDKDFTQTGGSVAVTGYGALFHVDGNYTQSHGTMTAQGTGGTVSVYGTFYISGDTFALDNGLVTAFNGVTVKPGGNLSVTNSATITGDLTNEGTITLAASALLEVSGDYTQTGTLNVSLGGPTAYGRLHVSGLATLGGTLNVTLYGGYMPSPMSQFTILTYGSRSGTFSGHNLPPLTIGVWQDPLLGYENNRFTLRTLYF